MNRNALPRSCLYLHGEVMVMKAGMLGLPNPQQGPAWPGSAQPGASGREPGTASEVRCPPRFGYARALNVPRYLFESSRHRPRRSPWLAGVLGPICSIHCPAHLREHAHQGYDYKSSWDLAGVMGNLFVARLDVLRPPSCDARPLDLTSQEVKRLQSSTHPRALSVPRGHLFVARLP